MTDLRNDTVTVYEYDYAGRFSGVNEYSTEDYYYNTTSKVTYDKQSKVTKRVLNISYNILDVADKSFNATETTSYVYDEENRLSSWTVSISKSLTQSLTYDDFDRVSKITNVSDGGFYNEVSYGYNDSSSWKIDSYTSKVGTSSVYTSNAYTYTYDYRGNITSITASDGKVVSYEYDEIGQLIREDNQKLGKTYVYTYDDAGNILTKKVYSYTTAVNLTGMSPIETKTYGYGNESWGDQLTSYGGTAITYDAIGNPLSYYNGSSYTFTWEGRRLKTATKGNQNFTFTYNVDGIRTSKTVNGVEHIYTLNGSQIVSEEWDGYLMVYIYDTNGAPIGMHFTNIRTENNGWLAYWFEKNLQGDIVAVYDNNGIKYAEYDYDAWGNCTTTYFNNGGVTAAMFNPFRYRGYYYDTDLGLYYLNSRYYDSTTGRFINADALMSGVSGSLDGYNLYAYCNNNPVMLVDESGQIPQSIIVKSNKFILEKLTQFVKDLNEDINNFDKYNTDIDIVYQSNYFSSYKGTVVIRHSSDFLSSWSIFGIIWLNHDLDRKEYSVRSRTLNHEYGHIVQERLLTTPKYIESVFVPSAFYNLLSRFIDIDYYNQPWEYDADMRGGVTRETHRPDSQAKRDNWWNSLGRMTIRYI